MGNSKAQGTATAVHFLDSERLNVWMVLQERKADNHHARQQKVRIYRALDIYDTIKAKDESGMRFFTLGDGSDTTRLFDLDTDVVNGLIDHLEGPTPKGISDLVLLAIEERLRDVKRGAYAVPANPETPPAT